MKVVRITPERLAEINERVAASSPACKASCQPEIVHFHPTDPVEDAGITYFESLLKEYQVDLCRWMRERAKPTDHYPAGGALLLEPGLGKTLTTLFFLFSTVLPNKPKDVGPVVLVMARNCRPVWFDEIKRIANWINQSLTIATINGSDMDVLSCDFLVTTPNRLAAMDKEARSATFSPVPGKMDPRRFFATRFCDLVVDEADMLRNGDDTTWWSGIAAVKRERTWALTGTPVHKNETDFYNLLLLLGVPTAVSQSDFAGTRATMTRRLTRADVSKSDTSLSLPPCTVHEHVLDFATTEESEAYAQMFTITCEIAVEEVQNRAPGGSRVRRGATFNTHLTSLRRACVIPALSNPARKPEADRESGPEEREPFVLTNASAQRLIRDLTTGKRKRHERDRRPPIDRPGIPEGPLGEQCTKIRAVVDFVRAECERRPTLVFSQWLDPVFLIQKLLVRGGIHGVETYHGLMTTQCQEDVIGRVRTGGVKVLIATVSSAKSSLNLTEFSTVVFVDPVLDPQDTVQAVHRVHRHGQKHPVEVHYFLMGSTVEMRVHAIAQSHRALADGLVDGGLTPHQRVVVNSERFLSEFNQPSVATTTQWRSSAVRATAVAAGADTSARSGIPEVLMEKLSSLRTPVPNADQMVVAGPASLWSILAEDMKTRPSLTTQDIAAQFQISSTSESTAGCYMIFAKGTGGATFLAPWRALTMPIPVYRSMSEFKTMMVTNSRGGLQPFIPARGIFERMGTQMTTDSIAQAVFFREESKLLMFRRPAQ